MEKIYFTITGTKYYHGKDFLESGMKVQLVKEPDNQHDKEAIQVRLDGLDTIGYVANSSFTLLGDSMSAGRIYDKIGQTAYGKVLFVLPQGVLCKLNKKSLSDK